MRTKRNNYFCVLIILLVLIEITSIFLMYKSSNNRNTLLDNVNLKEQIKNMKGIAIMLEQSDGTYKESSTNTFPTDMKFNSELSGCIDNLGNKIENSLTYENGIANVETSNTSYCYLYFDGPTDTEKMIENVSSDTLWKSTLEDDGYRFVGTNPDNYVCFGYSNSSIDCDFTNATNTDLYAYRIIGIFEDSSGEKHLKLIKKEALNTAYAWHRDDVNDVSWENSDIYKGLNGISGGNYSNLFIGNTTYSYMQDTNWTDKIEDWTWTTTNTQTYYIGGLTSNVGIDYYHSWPIGIYNSEHQINTTTGCYQTSDGSAVNCTTTAAYTSPKAKIGLMYASDYALSLGKTAALMTGSTYTNRAALKTGWMHINNNDKGYGIEWTSSRYGTYNNSNIRYLAWTVTSEGGINKEGVSNGIGIRPVFYLTSDVKISGEGSSTNPYIIS